MLVTVQLWNSVPSDGAVAYRDDWAALTGAVIEAVDEDPEVRVRFASEGTDWSLVEGGVRTANGRADLDPFEAKTFVVTATAPHGRVASLEDRLDALCEQHAVPVMWVSRGERLSVLGHGRPRRTSS